jgi:serine/threonine protein phosphatase PrpC
MKQFRPYPGATAGPSAGADLSALETGHKIVRWAVLGQSAEKPINDCFASGDDVVWRKNEDRYDFRKTPTGLMAAIADGAGSSGMFCGAWAKTLVERLPDTPLDDIDSLNRWMDGFWKDFSESHKKQASADASKLNKFVREGSCATLVVCWLQCSEDGKGACLQWLGYGDSPIYVFEKREDALVLRTAFPRTLREMTKDPHLLNWKDIPDGARLETGSLDLRGPATVVLASDGIGQFVLLRYLADIEVHLACGEPAADVLHAGLKHEFRQLLQSNSSKLADLARSHMENQGDGVAAALEDFRTAMSSPSEFLRLVKQHHARGLLPNDDSTLVVIDIDMGANEIDRNLVVDAAIETALPAEGGNT